MSEKSSLRQPDGKKLLKRIVALVKEAGGLDNISIIVAKLQQTIA